MIVRPLLSTASSSTHTSKPSTVPPGKKWPTLRVRTTTSRRTDSPRRTAGFTLSSGATTGSAGVSTAVPAPKFIDSSPTAKVLLRRGSVPATCRSSPDAPEPVRTRPKTSTDTAPSCRNDWTACICFVCPFTNGSAVLAAANRWLLCLPSLADGSVEATRGMWQSAQVIDFAG